MESRPPAPGAILPDLRAATGGAHQRLEDAVQIERRVTDLAAYRRLLELFLGFYRPLEDRLLALAGWQESGLDLSQRSKTPWLEDDLLALGIPQLRIIALPSCTALPSMTSLSRGYGCLYVLEGATLGGRQITGMMAGSQVPLSARRFFASYGAATGERWREFTAAMEVHSATVDQAGRAAILHAAKETFACLHDWFVTESTGS